MKRLIALIAATVALTGCETSTAPDPQTVHQVGGVESARAKAALAAAAGQQTGEGRYLN